MTKRQTKYIVKRNYDNRRTDTDAFLRLIKKSSKLNKTNEIEYNKYNIDSNKKSAIIKIVLEKVVLFLKTQTRRNRK
ncbi:TPA: hypothetical protein ACGVF2_000033 [Streptococcus agalactiae]